MIARAYSPRTMLDSGAFSAWYHKDTVDLDEYIDFVRDHGRRFCSIVALDQIPGEKGSAAKTTREVEAAAKQSHVNFERMRKAGIDCIPVFHQGEDFKWLKRMLDERIPYIGISPYMKSKQDSILKWMDKCFTLLSDKDGKPLCKTHGFGVTGHQIVRRYPWFSVDSTSWALSAGFGNVLMPSFRHSGPDFTHPEVFSISERDVAGNKSMVRFPVDGYQRKITEAYFEKMDLTFTTVRNFQEARLAVNAAYFMGLEKQLGVEPFAFRIRGYEPRLYKDRAADFDYTPAIFLATMVKIQQQGVVLTRMKARNRLISYYDCRRFSPAQIKEYTSQGYCERGAFNYKRGSKSQDLRRRMKLLERIIKGEVEDAED